MKIVALDNILFNPIFPFHPAACARTNDGVGYSRLQCDSHLHSPGNYEYHNNRRRLDC